MKEDFRKRLKTALSEKNMSQSELARKLNIHRGTINNYVSGKHEPDRDRIDKIAKCLNVNPAWLLGYNVTIEAEKNYKISGKESVNIAENTGNITYNSTNNTTNNNDCCENLNPAEQNIDDTIALQQQDKLLQTEMLLLLKELSVTSKEILITLKEIKNNMNK